MKKGILLIAVALLLASSLVAVGCPRPVLEEPPVEPIRLGAVNPLGDITGRQSAQGMKLAVAEINAAGGILGRPLELIVMDDEFSPAVGAAAIEKLATVHEVDIFIGGMASGVHLAQIPILAKHGRVTVWIGAASHLVEAAIAALPDHDWYFHLHPWDYQQVEGTVEGWAAIVEKFPQIRLDRMFVAYEEGAFGAAGFAISRALFADVTIEGESFTSAVFGGGDFRAVLRHAKEFNPDAFVWVGFDPDALGMMVQAKEIGFAPPVFLGTPPGWPVGFGEIPLSEAVWLYGMWSPELKGVSPEAAHFWWAFIEKFGEEPATYFAPLGYVNVKFVAAGIERAGTLERGPLIEALREVRFEDTAVGWPLTIAPSRLIRHQGFTRQMILQWQGGRQEVIWPFEVATAEPIFPFPRWEDR
ncbi:MAG: Leucine-, isoleucine-, valine-, threonine-, and alanine-binding protein [Dehalococcoidia bacterium]|nr:Leucine-, isoleucine-, valine-, threonine-, and alanine-binding protein [Bacillota bacterium]MBT9165574.1 Leucine-, isoleucine-, valine-, threonine-, and alanine-binding protein [Chloroflexota bacterium]